MGNISLSTYLEAENKYVFYLLVFSIKQNIQVFILSQQQLELF